MSNLLASDLNYILQHTSPIWDKLQGQRIFITGGTGFVGTWLLETLVWANQQFDLALTITVLTRDKKKFLDKVPHLAQIKALSFLEGDVRHFHFISGQFDYVIHAATDACAIMNAKQPQRMLETIIQGTSQVLNFAKATGVRKMLYLSSGAIYGKQPPKLNCFTESYLSAPITDYPPSAYYIGKRTAEQLCILQSLTTQLNITIARGFAFVGPYLPLNKHFAIGNFIRDGLMQRPIQINSDGQAYRSYQYIADLIIWLLFILVKGKNAQAYNVGSAQAISILNLANLVANCFNPRPEIIIASNNSSSATLNRYIPDVQAAKTLVGMTSEVSLSDGIEKTIAWHRQLQIK